MPHSKFLIIGSGPSAFAAAKMLASKNQIFDVFDAGLTQSPRNVENAKNAVGAVRKLIFGLDFPFAEFPAGGKSDFGRTMAAQSFARGGFTNVWGATMLPYTNSDLDEWPISYQQLSPYYDFISENVPIAAEADELAKKYPLSKTFSHPLKGTSRFENLLLNHKSVEGVHFFGQSRLAVTNATKGPSCIYCSRCIEGCDFGLIWSSSNYWSSLPDNCSYFPERRVSKIMKVEGKFQIEYINLKGTKEFSQQYTKVFLGAGPLETFRILHKSKLVQSKTTVQDSQIIFAPIYMGGKKKFEEEHALAQAFLRIEDPVLHPINVQLYDYTNDVLQRARKISPLIRLIPRKFLEYVLQRFIFCLIYLDSRDSDQILLSIVDEDSISLKPVPLDESKIPLARKIFKEWCKLNGLKFFPSLSKVGRVGEGVHYGSSLKINVSVNTDCELYSLNGLHIIDSSTFPAIPSGPITYTVMANAARIADVATK